MTHLHGIRLFLVDLDRVREECALVLDTQGVEKREGIVCGIAADELYRSKLVFGVMCSRTDVIEEGNADESLCDMFNAWYPG